MLLFSIAARAVQCSAVRASQSTAARAVLLLLFEARAGQCVAGARAAMLLFLLAAWAAIRIAVPRASQ